MGPVGSGMGWAGVEGGGTGAVSRRDMFLGCDETERDSHGVVSQQTRSQQGHDLAVSGVMT